MTLLRYMTAGVLLLALSTAAPVPVGGRTAVRNDAQASARGAMLTPTTWLAAHVNDPNLVLFHVGDPAGYAASHIPGARLVAMKDVSAPMPAQMSEPHLMLEMSPAAGLERQLEALGVSDDSRIVIYYGDDWYSPSTRIYFSLVYAGLGERTTLLDGGMPAWVREGRPTTAEVPAARTGRLSPLTPQPLVVDAAFVQAHATADALSIVDARDRVFYDGVQAGSDAGDRGHIPGAKSVPFADVFDERGALRPASELAALFARAGVGDADEVVGYCHIGQQATAMLFAAKSLGHRVKLYDGSMNDWTDRKLPLEVPKKGGRR